MFLQIADQQITHTAAVNDVRSVVRIIQYACLALRYGIGYPARMGLKYQVVVPGAYQRRTTNLPHLRKSHPGLVYHHLYEWRDIRRHCPETVYDAIADSIWEYVAAAGHYYTAGAGMQDFHLEGHVASVAVSEDRRANESQDLDELIYILGHVGIVILAEWRVAALSARIDGIYLIAVVLKNLCRRLHVVAAAAVSVQQEYRPPVTLDLIAEALTVDRDRTYAIHLSGTALPDGTD